MIIRIVALLAAAALTVVLPALSTRAETVNFDGDTAGAIPAGWKAGVTGSGTPLWTVEADPTAPSRPTC